MLHRFVNLIKKEFISVFQDRLTCGQLVLFPFAMLVLFSAAHTMEVKNKTLGVINEDDGDLGTLFVRLFEPGETYSDIIAFSDPDEARRAVDEQRVLMLLRVPRDFSARLSSGRDATVLTILDGRKSNAAQIANGYAALVAARFAREIYKDRAAPSSLPVIELRALYNPNLEFKWFNQPVLLILLSQMVVLLITSMSVAKERELGTFEQLLVSPLTPLEIVIGKMVPGIALGAAEGVFMFLMGRYWYGVPFVGSAALLAGTMLLFMTSEAAVGLAISSLCSTQQQAFLGDCLFIVPSMILSGFVSPIENMPRALQTFTLINPTRHTLKAVTSIYLKDLSAAELSTELSWMAGIAAVLVVLAAWSFKHRTR